MSETDIWGENELRNNLIAFVIWEMQKVSQNMINSASLKLLCISDEISKNGRKAFENLRSVRIKKLTTGETRKKSRKN
ncbi:CLUMA_CG017514, isoform A [Clunio marinus]|uniref:CLUMA_CG017514, isoform A n=1 Tax=Clunio marinus TaxID=568069 RepID=A0A1J1IW43_9DIPT|nr:CLUMA_CG017514, isoform A [Clunio marinus]